MLTETDREEATLIDSHATIKETLKARESRVYRFPLDEPNRPEFGLLSEELVPGQKFAPETAGYALFDSEGKIIGDVMPAGKDYPLTKVNPGEHYVKILGPGLVHIKLH